MLSLRVDLFGRTWILLDPFPAAAEPADVGPGAMSAALELAPPDPDVTAFGYALATGSS